jgi:hypothetical protein
VVRALKVVMGVTKEECDAKSNLRQKRVLPQSDKACVSSLDLVARCQQRWRLVSCVGVSDLRQGGITVLSDVVDEVWVCVLGQA